ncbi:hypothetical protein AB6A40_009608 [Gnathostoma spinigerum]|uniref:Calcyclin-binding protein n=1 Tax=Gnathostoma spinigerum TaxID=75299 RepID=A0ABD6EXL6_9BILA
MKKVKEMEANEEQALRNDDGTGKHMVPHPGLTVAPLPMVKITNYAWDQNDKFVKLYLTMPGIQAATAEQVVVKFTEKSVDVSTVNIEGKDYSLAIKELLNDIDPEKSTYKQKENMLLVMLKKQKETESWKYLTKAEDNANKPNIPKFDEKSDPQESLMDMMREMYEKGDDEMKRTIRKSFYESQNKMKNSDI